MPGALLYLGKAVKHLLTCRGHHADLLLLTVAQQDVKVLQIFLTVAAPVWPQQDVAALGLTAV